LSLVEEIAPSFCHSSILRKFCGDPIN